MYRGGIFNGSCRNEVNHALLLVGFGTDPNAGDYWILKNTWGDWWGDNGYMYLPITIGSGTCGINQYVSLSSMVAALFLHLLHA